ncbi:dockerin type I domain-containing protein [Posidoniimonas polymericola]|uniref:dockerin type I domain-containing protein n=1 Tax=Posidoniimonas polymericola TaxID=2528002 RepID=UPI0011B7A5C9|nr:dockerin type I domain-containing protein [Posidoniimonas polymericola]
MAQSQEGTIARFDELTGAPIPGWGVAAASPNAFGPVSGVAVDGSGVLYVSSRFAGQILQYDLQTGAPIGDGVFAMLPNYPPAEPGGEEITAAPGGLHFGPDGYLYVADNAGTKVYRYDVTDGSRTDAVTGLRGAGGLGFQSDGTLLSTSFVIEMDANPNENAVYAGVEPAVTKLVPEEASFLFSPTNLLVNEDDSFWVADLISNRVVKFSDQGAYTTEFSVPAPLDYDPEDNLPGDQGGIHYVSDLVHMPSGELLVSTLGVTSIYSGGPKNFGELLRYDASGAFLGRLASDLSPIGSMVLVPGVVETTGDYNRDGAVDAADYALWRQSYGARVTPFSNADGNGDGQIDAADYTVWRDNAVIVEQTFTAVTPEPAAAVLLPTAVLGGLFHRRR